MQKKQTKTQRRSGRRRMAALTKLRNGAFQIAIPTHGLFTSFKEEHLKNILRDAGYGYYYRTQRVEIRA